MKRMFVVFAVLTITLAMSGCATRTKMAFVNDGDRLTDQSKPVYLMTATIRNAFKTSYQPKLLVVNVEKPAAKEAADRLNFVTDDKTQNGNGTEGTGNSYFLRLELAPGKYEIVGLTAVAFSFPFNGIFFAPVHSDLEVKDNGVYYLGHISATVRERQGNEFKAGPSVPLIDQSVAGASSGSFDIIITDEFAVDEPAFRAKFPALKDVAISKAILPAFDRSRAQKWWEEH